MQHFRATFTAAAQSNWQRAASCCCRKERGKHSGNSVLFSKKINWEIKNRCFLIKLVNNKVRKSNLHYCLLFSFNIIYFWNGYFQKKCSKVLDCMLATPSQKQLCCFSWIFFKIRRKATNDVTDLVTSWRNIVNNGKHIFLAS